jgi:hypothetical protein
MKKLFLIFTPIIFLFCLNIGIQTASAVTCSGCQRCVSQDCYKWGETCTPHSQWVCDKTGCTGYGDIPYNCRNECVSGMTYGCTGGMGWVCTHWNPGKCYAWNNGVCVLSGGGYCEEGHYECSSYGWYCPGNMYSYVCDYKYGCTSTGCVSGHTDTWTECVPNGNCVGGWYCTSCAPYCSGSNSNCGCQSCQNCSAQNHCDGTTYYEYHCIGNACAFTKTENSPNCGGCTTVADCTDYSVGQCVTFGNGSEGVIGNKRCQEGECQYQPSMTCLLGCCTSGRCCTGCDDKCIVKEGNPMSKCSGNTLKVLDLVNCASGCQYNQISCGCGCDPSTNPPSCLSSNDIIWGCEDIGEPSEKCDGDWFKYSGYHCKGASFFNISDDFFAKIKEIFSTEAKADEVCHYETSVYCENGCGLQDGKEQCLNKGLCPGHCFPDNCDEPECVGCALCVLDCPDICAGSIYQTGGFVANNENGHATCFYQNGEWCGDGCCGDPSDPDFEPPEAPSCYWELKECGFGGCPVNTHKGKLCVGDVANCKEDVCSLGEISCVPDASCGGAPPPGNEPPVAKIDYSPSDIITTDETNFTLKGDGSYDTDGSIVNYNWNIPDLSRTQNTGNPNFFLGNPAVGGPYAVTLVVTDDGGATDTTNGSFTVLQALAADFEWEPEFPLRKEEVNFTDLSAGDIVSWSWTFEDGDVPAGEESKQHPQNIKFNSNGSKEVTLTITDSLSNSVTETKYVDVKIPMPDWRETHPKTENIFDDPFLFFASLFEYLEG